MIAGAVSLAWLGALALPGIAALGRTAPFLTPLERFSYGSIVGIVAGTLALLPLGIVAGGLTVPVVVLTGAVSVLIAFALWAGRRGVAGVRASVRGARPLAFLERLDAWGTALFAILAVRWLFLWSSALQLGSDGLAAGHEYIWSDWPTHLGIVTRFAWGDNFPPQNTLYAGLPLSYHYLSDLTPAAFVTIGMDPTGALPLHSYVLSLLAALCLWAFVRRLSLRTSVATLATILFLFGAGIGWLPTLATLDRTHDLLGTLLSAPWDAKAAADLHLRFFNPYLAFLMSQRAYLYGLPIAILMITILVAAVRRRRLALFVLAGVVGGLLPLSHLPTLLAMAMTTPFLVILLTPRPWRDPLRRIPWPGWIVFHGVWIAVAVPQLLTQLGGGQGALAAARFQLGWVADPDPWWWFWLKNLGLFIPLALVALASARILPPRSRAVTLALMPIFLIVNVAVFQPWDWDDHKILIYWFLGATIVVAALLVDVWRGVRERVAGRLAEGPAADIRGRRRSLRWSPHWPARQVTVRGLLVVAVLTMIGAPVLENLDQLEGHMRFGMLSTEQIQVASDVRSVAAPDAIVVTGMQSHDPVMMLSGRQVLMGYWGQLWVSGIPYQTRQAEVGEIYKLSGAGLDALRRYKVSYVVVGPDERATLGANDQAWSRFPVATRTPNWRVYDVRSLWS